jgi:hypothetical protein
MINDGDFEIFFCHSFEIVCGWGFGGYVEWGQRGEAGMSGHVFIAITLLSYAVGGQ